MQKKNNTLNVPNLRFPGFEDEWERKKLGEVATNKSKKYNPKNKQTFIKCIELEHLASESGQLLGFTDGSQSGSIKNVFQKNEVLFGKLRPYLKKYLQPNFDGVCSSEIWVLNGNEISNNFLYYLIQTNKFIDLANQSSGSKMPRADWNIVENGIFSIPSCNEQKKLSAFLSLLDERIQTQSKIIRELSVLKVTLAKRIFAKKFKLKDDNGKDFPEWQKKKLGEIGAITTGSSNREDSILNGEYTFFDRSQDVRTSNRFLFDKEAVIVPGEGKEFIPKYFIGKFDLHQRTYAVFDFIGINGKYLYYHLLNDDKHLQSQAVGSTVKSLRLPMFKTMPINLPSIPEQTKIANFLSSLDSKINIETQFLHKLEEQKKYFLHQMFV
jgi:type I restriction enzyme S subunit